VFDWYKRTTKNWLVDAPILSVFGLRAPYVNGGDVVNQGVELALTWQDRAGTLSYGGGLNFTLDRYKSFWSSKYTGVARANMAVGNLATIENEEVRRQKMGEALFLRAYTYFELVQLFGDIPFIEKAPENVEEAKTPPTQASAKIIGMLCHRSGTLVNGDENYAKFVRDLNLHIDHFNNLIAQRRGRNKKKNESSEDTEE
jgi:hypothetical protein